MVLWWIFQVWRLSDISSLALDGWSSWWIFQVWRLSDILSLALDGWSSTYNRYPTTRSSQIIAKQAWATKLRSAKQTWATKLSEGNKNQTRALLVDTSLSPLAERLPWMLRDTTGEGGGKVVEGD
jgi:hypothetical protein